jgi:hypothetical protein
VCSIEVVLGLEALRRKVPETARQELRDGPFGSDVIRASMVPAAEAQGEVPHRVSVKGASRTPPAFAEALPDGTPLRCRRLRRSCWSRWQTMRSGSASTEWSKSPQHPPRPQPLPLDPPTGSPGDFVHDESERQNVLLGNDLGCPVIGLVLRVQACPTSTDR